MQMQMQLQIVTQLGPYDVLFGRGSGPNDHEGNVRFRKLVAERKSEYMATNHRLTKAKIAREIVDAVFRENGRFLKKIEGDDARMLGIPDGMEAWTGVDEDTIMEKAKQALRQNTSKNKSDSGSRSPIPNPGTRNAIPNMFAQQMPLVPLHGGGMHPPAQNVGYVVDDLEPIPIPTSSSAYVDEEEDEDDGVGEESLLPTPVREVGESGVNSYKSAGGGRLNDRIGYGNTNDRIGYGNTNDRIGYGNSMDPPPSVQPRYKPDVPNSSGQNSMQPPAARTPTIVRSSGGVLHRGMEKSMDMGELMESFGSKTRLGTGAERDFGNSTETMGTIEPMSVGSTNNMSIATFNSAVFSVQNDVGDRMKRPSFRLSNERSFNELQAEEPPSYIRTSLGGESAVDPLSSDFMSSTRFGLASDASMSFAELGASGSIPRNVASGANTGNRRSSVSTLKNVQENGHREADDSFLGEVDAQAVDFPTVDDANDGIEGMGSSSLHLLKGMLMSQDEIAQQGGPK